MPVQLRQTVVPLLLSTSTSELVELRGRTMAMDALGELWRASARDEQLRTQLEAHFEALFDAGRDEHGHHEVCVHPSAVAGLLG